MSTSKPIMIQIPTENINYDMDGQTLNTLIRMSPITISGVGNLINKSPQNTWNVINDPNRNPDLRRKIIDIIFAYKELSKHFQSQNKKTAA